MYLEKINSPSDIKSYSLDEMKELAKEIRTALLKKLSVHGGHCGPNFGMVEATIALHYVFNSPVDKFVFDVSHQTYPHKMLTGRAYGFLDESRYDDITGYSSPEESEHDFFTVGHTSTSVSLACGLAKARDLKGEKSNVVAIIGDGSLSGGFGEKIARFFGNSNVKVLNFGLKKEFLDRYNPADILKENHLTKEQIVDDILALN